MQIKGTGFKRAYSSILSHNLTHFFVGLSLGLIVMLYEITECVLFHYLFYLADEHHKIIGR
jgi:hypothetical protein